MYVCVCVLNIKIFDFTDFIYIGGYCNYCPYLELFFSLFVFVPLVIFFQYADFKSYVEKMTRIFTYYMGKILLLYYVILVF